VEKEYPGQPQAICALCTKPIHELRKAQRLSLGGGIYWQAHNACIDSKIKAQPLRKARMFSNDGMLRKGYLADIPGSAFGGDTYPEIKAGAEAFLRDKYECPELTAYRTYDDIVEIWMPEECRKRHGIA